MQQTPNPIHDLRARICADIVLNVAKSPGFANLPLDKIGIPPPFASAATCGSHGTANFCNICRFNLCKICGLAGVPKKAFWTGKCNANHEGLKKYSAHTKRVQEILKTEAAKLPVVSVQEAPPPAPQVPAEVASAAPKVPEAAKVSKASKAAKAAKAPRASPAAEKSIKKKKAASPSRILAGIPFKLGETTSKVVLNKRTGKQVIRTDTEIIFQNV